LSTLETERAMKFSHGVVSENSHAVVARFRSFFHTTICVLEGLLEYEKAKGATAAVTDARARAQAYLLERRLFRRLSSGEVIDPKWARFTFPTLWHYDVLRGLDNLRRAGVKPDERVAEVIGLVAESRQPDGRWLLHEPHRDAIHDLEGGAGHPSRWKHPPSPTGLGLVFFRGAKRLAECGLTIG
jgi:hypothetical protein